MRTNETAPLRLLTIDESASQLRVSAVTVRRLIRDRHLRVVRIGRSVRVRPEEIARFIDANEDGGR